MLLSERKAAILKNVIDMYSQTNEPVGSKTICEHFRMDLSSATVRNEMSDLAELGLLAQTHTSSGRVPTEEGYRVYVNELMERYALSPSDREYVNSLFPRRIESAEVLLMKACNVLSEITGCTSISTTPTNPKAHIARIELIPVSRYTYMLAVLTSSGTARSRIFRSSEPIPSEKLEAFATSATKVLSGVSLSEVGVGTVQSVAAMIGAEAFLFSPVISEMLSLIEGLCEINLISSGEILLFSGNYPPDRAKEIFNLVSEGQRLAHSLSESKGDTLVSIGNDNSNDALKKSSLITAKYSYESGGGRIGVIGPVKLDYTHTIPIVEYIALVVDTILSNLSEDRRTQNVKI